MPVLAVYFRRLQGEKPQIITAALGVIEGMGAVQGLGLAVQDVFSLGLTQILPELRVYAFGSRISIENS